MGSKYKNTISFWYILARGYISLGFRAVSSRYILLADGEFQASKQMTEATKLYGEAPLAIKLRELQTLVEIAREKNLIIVTPAIYVS